MDNTISEPKKISGVIRTHLTFDQTKMLTDVSAALDMPVEELADSIVKDIINLILTPAEDLTDFQQACIERLNAKSATKPISLLQYLRELDVNPELFFLEMENWIETTEYKRGNIDVVELIKNRPDLPYKAIWEDFIALRKEAEMLPIEWTDEIKLVKKWIVGKKNLLNELSYV